jgi:hypothetical protein
MGQTGYISTTHQSLLHSTLNITVHFNGSNGAAYIRPLSVRYSNIYVKVEKKPDRIAEKFHRLAKIGRPLYLKKRAPFKKKREIFTTQISLVFF